MKIHILSDLHIDHAPFRPTDTLPLRIDADVVVLAGDLSNNLKGVKWAKEAFADKPVVLVTGNHEFYGPGQEGIPMQEVQARIRAELAGSNVHYLENEEVVIQGVRFLGATLWTNFEIEGAAWRDIAMNHAKKNMADFALIRSTKDALLTPLQSARLHEKSVAWLKMKLSEPFDGKTVVVSHHGCTRRSIDPKYGASLLNGAFCSDLSDLMGRCTLWTHGHTHSSHDYDFEGTRVIVNPRGYCESNFYQYRLSGAPIVERCENQKFDPFLVVEI